MTPPHLQTATALLLAAAAAIPAQTPATSAKSATSPRTAPRPATPYINHNLIFLDPAHGGPDNGAELNNRLLEKDITLALANRIRALLAGNNLTVLFAREADTSTATSADPEDAQTPTPTPTPDQRAGIANHAHPVACILLHATAAGNGVHIVTSPLPPPETSADIYPDSYAAPTSSAPRVLPWESAQTDSIPQSLRLAREIGTAVSRANLPVHLSHASVKPIDSLTCPAVAIEIAPLVSGPTQVSDPVYQGRLAGAIATALLSWRGHADPPAPPQTVPPPASSTPPLSPTPARTRPARRPPGDSGSTLGVKPAPGPATTHTSNPGTASPGTASPGPQP